MKRSHTGESNLLPHFSFISAGEGGGNSWLNGYSGPRPFNNWTRGIDSNGFPDSCPDDLFGPLSDYPDVSIPASSMGPNPTLPYLLQDNQDCNRTQSDVPVIVLEDEHIRAAITPQWGGKIWSMFDKKHKRQMVFNNPAHQVKGDACSICAVRLANPKSTTISALHHRLPPRLDLRRRRVELVTRLRRALGVLRVRHLGGQARDGARAGGARVGVRPPQPHVRPRPPPPHTHSFPEDGAWVGGCAGRGRWT